MHIPPLRKSELPRVLEHEGHLSAVHPNSGERVGAGRICVAPPDQHLIFSAQHLELWHGPKENLHRPAINPTFRSAAVTFKERAIGVLLSGALDDGFAGLWWIERFGGLAIVQDPGQAAFPDMPRGAVEHVDYIVPGCEMASLLAELTRDQSSAERSRVG